MPLEAFTCGDEVGPLPTAPQAIRPVAATISNANSIPGARRRIWPAHAPLHSTARLNNTPVTPSNCKDGEDPLGKIILDAAVCGFVAIESVTVCGAAPGVIVADGAKEIVVPAGMGVDWDTPNVIGLVNVPSIDETTKANVAVCPAVIGGLELGGVTAKSDTGKLMLAVVPPPGGGFETVMISVPPCERSLGSSVTFSSVELSKVVIRGLPFTRTTDSGVKPVPVTFKVSSRVPAGRLGGEMEPPPGCGLLTGSVIDCETKPSGLVTIT